MLESIYKEMFGPLGRSPELCGTALRPADFAPNLYRVWRGLRELGRVTDVRPQLYGQIAGPFQTQRSLALRLFVPEHRLADIATEDRLVCVSVFAAHRPALDSNHSAALQAILVPLP